MRAALRSNTGSSLTLVAGALICGLCAFPLAGQEVGREAVDQPAESSVADQVRADVDDTSLRWVGIGRVRYSTPMQVSVGAGAVVARVPSSHDCVAFCEYRGLVLHLEPGLAGGQLGVGYARLIAGRRPGSPFLSNIYVGWSGRAALLRTWGDSDLDPARQTLAGFEAQFSLPRVSFTLGAMRRISSAHQDADSYVYTAGIGWGF